MRILPLVHPGVTLREWERHMAVLRYMRLVDSHVAKVKALTPFRPKPPFPD